MKRITAISLFASLLLHGLTTYGFGAKGHKLVADIAKTYASQSAIDSVNKYLGGISWQEASIWMDEIKSDPSYNYLKPVHYINIEKGQEYQKTSETNIINELETVIDELRDRSKLTRDQINRHLKILFHLMGDLHQPLHVGYLIDRGGNNIAVNFLGQSTNLHKVWDSELIEHDATLKPGLIEQSKKLTSQEITKQQKVDILAWMTDSRAFLPQVYNFKNGNIDDVYVSNSNSILERQILYGGIRLAGVLNYIFSPGSTPASQPMPLTFQNENIITKSSTSTTPDSAKYYLGSTITICGKVTGTHVGKTGVMKLNFGGKYPDNTFTAVVFADDASKFKGADYYDGNSICVTGKIENYHGKPEVILKTADQIIEK